MSNNENIQDFIIDEEPIENNYEQPPVTVSYELEYNRLLAEQELQTLKNHLEESKQNQKSRKKYAAIFAITMIVQLIVINLFVLAQGKLWIKLDVSIFNVFLIGVFTQLVAVVTIIFTNVFPKDHDKNKTDLQKALFRKSKDEE